MKTNCTKLIIVFTTFLLSSCLNSSSPQDNDLLISKKILKKSQPYRNLEVMAYVGVSSSDAGLALSGDAETALKIAVKFADLGKGQEARYWYHIAADNGSPIGMQHLSVFLRKTDCRRANFWLKKYLSFDDNVVSNEDRELSTNQLKTYENDCRSLAI